MLCEVANNGRKIFCFFFHFETQTELNVTIKLEKKRRFGHLILIL